MDILLTNDDGYESYGIHALYDALESIGNVTIVAPRDDQSATGRTHSTSVEYDERERGYVIDGTPVDCILTGTELFVPKPDLVVAGCNQGANAGGHTLARSGTVSAAVEATFKGIPAIAISLYIPESQWPLQHDEPSLYEEAKRTIRVLVNKTVPSEIYDNGGYLNVNVPLPEESTHEIAVTQPSAFYSYDIEEQNGEISIADNSWIVMDDEAVQFPPHTDRGALMNGQISVSPLITPHQSANIDTVSELLQLRNPHGTM